MKTYTVLIIFCFVACTKEGPQPFTRFSKGTTGSVVVNEMMATRSEQANEFGENSDWFELYNPGAECTLTAGAWFVTDDVYGAPRKYELPEVTIPSQGFVVIWCDGLDQEAENIHTNFKLSPDDRSLCIVQSDGEKNLIIDEVLINASPDRAISFGRAPDGTAVWTTLSPPTPDAPNEVLAADD
jgi:hypothetical protein